MPYLFSYGTLQQDSVQANIFGRLLEGKPDNLIGFIIANLKIQDEEESRRVGKEFYPIAKYTGSFNNRIPGTVFEVTEEALNQADRYEGDQYKRILTILESGRSAWVYVEATAN
jgi:gamma-glutamylcyclotransferase (GGCT)/AIG2-like uncharacterized protein YtfP